MRLDPAARRLIAADGPGDLAWFPDRFEITVVGAGAVQVIDGDGDVIVEIRPPSLDAPVETVRGAD